MLTNFASKKEAKSVDSASPTTSPRTENNSDRCERGALWKRAWSTERVPFVSGTKNKKLTNPVSLQATAIFPTLCQYYMWFQEDSTSPLSALTDPTVVKPNLHHICVRRARVQASASCAAPRSQKARDERNLVVVWAWGTRSIARRETGARLGINEGGSSVFWSRLHRLIIM